MVLDSEKMNRKILVAAGVDPRTNHLEQWNILSALLDLEEVKTAL